MPILLAAEHGCHGWRENFKAYSFPPPPDNEVVLLSGRTSVPPDGLKSPLSTFSTWGSTSSSVNLGSRSFTQI